MFMGSQVHRHHTKTQCSNHVLYHIQPLWQVLLKWRDSCFPAFHRSLCRVEKKDIGGMTITQPTKLNIPSANQTTAGVFDLKTTKIYIFCSEWHELETEKCRDESLSHSWQASGASDGRDITGCQIKWSHLWSPFLVNVVQTFSSFGVSFFYLTNHFVNLTKLPGMQNTRKVTQALLEMNKSLINCSK